MVANGFFVVSNNWAWDLAELANRDGMSVKCKGLMFKGSAPPNLGIKAWVGNSMKQSDGDGADDEDHNEENEVGAKQQTSGDAPDDAPMAEGDASRFVTPRKGVTTSAVAPSPGSCSSARSAGRSTRPPVSPRPQLPAAKIQGIIRNSRR